MRRTLAVVFSSFALIAAMGHPAAARSPSVYPPDATPLGRDFPTWEGAYQVWMTEIPKKENPFLHPDSERNCELVDGAVMLAPVGANCAVPSGAPLMFSSWFWECSTAEGLGETYAKLRRCATRRFQHDFNADALQMQVLIDGKRLHRVRRSIFRTPGEIVDFPQRNIWGAEPGPSKSVTKGFLIVLRPLDPGLHTVRVRSRLTTDQGVEKLLDVFKLHVS
jgi:hypothetical protein